MKNVLFATTALVAMTGSAMAASHGGMAPAVSFSGEMTAGYNDAIENGIFWDANLDLKAVVDMGDSVTATLSTEIASGNELGGSITFTPTVEVVYTAGTFSASLKVGDLGDKGASEYWYADRDGMAVDVENQDATADARALLMFGNYGVAFGCEVIEDAAGTLADPYTGTCSQGAYNVGVGATFGSIKLGVGYDNSTALQTGVTAVSADATFGKFDLGVSYATSSAQNSVGVAAGATFGAIGVKAYFASNSTSSDAYGVSADYDAGAINVHAYYDSAASDTYGLDLGYKVTDALTASVGVQSGGSTTYYAGIVYAVNSNITATVSYANADEISGPEFKDGISAFITASF